MPCTKPFLEYARNNLYERGFFEEEMPHLLSAFYSVIFFAQACPHFQRKGWK